MHLLICERYMLDGEDFLILYRNIAREQTKTQPESQFLVFSAYGVHFTLWNMYMAQTAKHIT